MLEKKQTLENRTPHGQKKILARLFHRMCFCMQKVEVIIDLFTVVDLSCRLFLQLNPYCMMVFAYTSIPEYHAHLVVFFRIHGRRLSESVLWSVSPLLASNSWTGYFITPYIDSETMVWRYGDRNHRPYRDSHSLCWCCFFVAPGDKFKVEMPLLTKRWPRNITRDQLGPKVL